MAHYFRINDDIQIAPGARIIKAEQVSQIISAEKLIDEAHKKSHLIIAKAKEKYKAERDRGYEEGIENAKADKVRVINEAAKKSAEFSKNMERSVSDIVQSILTKVLGNFDHKALVCRLVKNAMKDYTRSQKIRVLVTPEHVDYLNDHLSGVIEEHPVIEFIEVVPDYSVEPGGCIIDAQTEMIFISLEDQLAAIDDMMKGIIGGSPL